MTAKIISITDSAAQRIREILSNAKDNEIKGVRVSVVTGGCAGMSYEMNYVKEINSSDEVVEDCGVKVYIDPKAIMYLLGTSTVSYTHLTLPTKRIV